jgi:NAD(P)-dependent dehydrogenase (short-subunit alcohol dehydrogenase family)
VTFPAFSLSEKVALVVGATHPIGRALAIALAEAGAHVALTTILRTKEDVDTVHACMNDILSRQRTSSVHSIDAASEQDVQTAVHRTVSQFGRLDILVNTPDLPFAKPLLEVSFGEWQRVLAVNLTSVYLACHAAAGPMLAQKKGRIINVVSLLGERGMANGSAYCAAQAGVLNLTRALALEWARDGITVNALGTGWTEGMGMLADETLRQQLARYLPTKRLAQPYEMGEAVIYLASDATDFLTGQVLWIDGGALSHL